MGRPGHGPRSLHPVHRRRGRSRGAGAPRARAPVGRPRPAQRRRRPRPGARRRPWRAAAGEDPRARRDRARARRRGRSAAAGARLGPPLGRARGRARRSARHPARPDRTDRPARRRPALHRPDCPPEMLSEGGIPQGDCAPVPWLLSSRGLWRLGADRRQRHSLRPRRRAAVGVDPGTCGPVAGAPAVRVHARRPATRVLPAHGLSGAASRVGLRLLEEPRRLRAPGRRARGLRRIREAPDPARRDRARLPLGNAVQQLGVQPPPVPRRARDDRDDATRRRAHRGVGDPVGQPRLTRRTGAAPARVRASAPRAGAQVRRRRRRRPFRAGQRPHVRDPVVDGNRLASRLHEHRRRGVVARAGQGGAGPGRRRDQGRRRRWLLHPRSRPPRRRQVRHVRRLGARRASPPQLAAGARRGPSRQRRRVRAQRLGRAAGHRPDLGRGPGLGLLVAARACRRHAVGRLQRHLELVARRRRLPRLPAHRALPTGAAAAVAAVRLLHAADARPRADAPGALALQRASARPLPRVRAGARAAGPVRPRGRSHRVPHRSSDHPPAVPDRSRRRSRVDDRRRLRLRPGAVGRAGARRRRPRARGRAAAG